MGESWNLGAGLASCVLGTSWLHCARWCLLASSWEVEDRGLFGQAFSSQFGISLADNAASKPHLSNEFLALEGKLAPKPSGPSRFLPGPFLDPGELAEKLPVVAWDGPWDGEWTQGAASSLFISCLACYTLFLVSLGLGSRLHIPVSEWGLVRGSQGV